MEVVFVGLLFWEHPKAQPEGGFRRSPGSNLRPLVYKVSDLTTAPRRLLKILIQPDVGTSYLSKILLLYGAKTNKTLV